MTSAIQLPFDFNKAANLSENVATSSFNPFAVATFTTNASQFEPGEFSNGINAFGSTNVFILHDAGAAFGPNQRYVYIALATQFPIVVKQIQLVVGTNAQGHSPSNPVSFVIEGALTEQFANTTQLGTFNSAIQTSQTVNVNFEVPLGQVYIRLRATSDIPDGSNYVAYSNVTLGAAFDEVGGPIELLYDFNTANVGALNVTTATRVPYIDTVCSTNASLFEPGEFPNGVVSFGSANNVFILHDAGSALNPQRYLFVAVATQLPFLLTSLSVNIGSNAQGSSPTNPVVIAVESSSTSGFASVVSLGTISTVKTTLVLNDTIQTGITFIRLRALSPIPDGSNYIAYDHLKLTGVVIAPA